MRLFPATVLGGRLHPHGIASWGPWDAGRLSYTPEEAVDKLLSVLGLVGNRKARTREEILGAVRASAGRTSAITVWIPDGMEEVAEEVWKYTVGETVGSIGGLTREGAQSPSGHRGRRVWIWGY